MSFVGFAGSQLTDFYLTVRKGALCFIKYL